MSAVTQAAPRWGSAGEAGDVRVAALGGGTGLPILLRGLRRWLGPRDPRALTAIVSVADDGGSSGRLRRAFDVLPMGDLRNCLLALAAVRVIAEAPDSRPRRTTLTVSTRILRSNQNDVCLM